MLSSAIRRFGKYVLSLSTCKKVLKEFLLFSKKDGFWRFQEIGGVRLTSIDSMYAFTSTSSAFWGKLSGISYISDKSTLNVSNLFNLSNIQQEFLKELLSELNKFKFFLNFFFIFFSNFDKLVEISTNYIILHFLSSIVTFQAIFIKKYW